MENLENKFLIFILFLHVCVCLCECDIKWFSIEKKNHPKIIEIILPILELNYSTVIYTQHFMDKTNPKFFDVNVELLISRTKERYPMIWIHFFSWIFECNEFFKLLFSQLVLNTRFKMIKMSGYFVINNFLSILIHCEVTHLYGSDNRVYN